MATWMTWNETPWILQGSTEAALVRLMDRMLQAAPEAAGAEWFLRNVLPEVASEFGTQWIGVLQPEDEWRVIAEFGRRLQAHLPLPLLREVLDRDAAGLARWGDEAAGWPLSAACGRSAERQCVLVLAGRTIAAEHLPAVLALARAIAQCLQWLESRRRDASRIERLRMTLEVASSFSRETETGPLLELIARQCVRLLDCDRSSIFIWDREQKEVVACPALGVEGGTLRLPDDTGIVGEVIHTGKSIRVDDAYADARFDQSVDRSSGYTTRNLLCTPLRDSHGRLIGAFEAINKRTGPFTQEDEESLNELGVQAANALRNVKEREQLIRTREQLAEQVRRDVNIIGESPAISALRSTIARLAKTDLPVLILGESGTGKEVVSQALHYQGPRAQHPFVAVNCAALTETLLESELFGHEKGAFTDAREQRRGKFELADGGTLFLDEIGDMSLGGQAKLLRVLEQKVIVRVGGSQAIPVDVRVVAATNSNLMAAVREKRFREDLYYRLSVVTLELPPLRDRPEDLLPLARHFLERFCRQANRPLLEISADARRRLQAHSWPGNVRELRNLMERLAFLAPGDRIEADDLAFILSPEPESALEPSADLGLDLATRQFQREFIRRSIKRVGENMSEAARLLGLHRSNLYRKMRQLKMKEVGGSE